MSTQPRRSPRLLAAEWKANAEAYHTPRNASRVPAGPPNPFVSTIPLPPQTQPVVTVSLVPNRPRRSPRLAAKLRTTIVEHARYSLIPLFDQLEQTPALNPHAHLVLQIMNYLIHFPMILVWSPKIRNKITEKMKLIWDQIKTKAIINQNLKNDINYCFMILKPTLVDIQSHPEYVS